MTRKQNSADKQSWKELMAGQTDFLKPLVQEVIQQVLELEMEETLQAGKGERTAERQGYRSGSYEVCAAAAGGSLPVSDPGCAL